MSEVTIDYFIKEYLKALEEENAAVFAGAGLSVERGYVNWSELMRDIAKDLGLSVDKETDLIAVAQYHTNKFQGNRTKLDDLLIKEFTKDAKPSRNHELIAALPVAAVWTTNYDTLIEDAFKLIGKQADKVITVQNLAQTTLRKDVVVYKMHGDISQPQDAILTKDDYENYNEKRGLFTIKLQGDLVSKTFLFLGFSFTDPNIDYILSRVRALIGQKNERHHYYITKRIQKPKPFTGKKKADYEYNSSKQRHFLTDLQRFGIQTVIIDDFPQITEILEELHRNVYRRSIFVSGSAHEYDPLGRERVERLAYNLGREIIKRGYNLVTGVGLGIGGTLSLGALEELYTTQSSYSANNRTLLRPFPQAAPAGISQAEFWRKHREDMISKSGFAVFLCGNKKGKKSGAIKIADGVLKEWEIAKAMKKYPIPIGATGHAARQIWDEVNASLNSFYPKTGFKQHFETLGDENSSDEQIIDAVLSIIKRIIK